MIKKIILSWSTGKDSAWTLHQLQNNPEYEVAGLFCTVNQASERTAVHAVRLELLHKQAECMKLPLDIIKIPYPCSNREYENMMQKLVDDAKSRGIQCIAYGDLFLEDIRDYRVAHLNGTGITPIFPLWNMPTDRLSRDMVNGGIKAVITCINPKALDAKYAGRQYDHKFLDSLPAGIDPCGENGEFHSFVYDAPMFKGKINVAAKKPVEKNGFVYADIVPLD